MTTLPLAVSAWDTIAVLLKVLGSLGVFLFGMKVMSEGIQKVAGDKMRAALASMTSNRFSAALTGLFTTGLVQSSSATTVLVVSFVNAGLLTLVESIGVIMGANLGTTLTAWIIAVIGKFKITQVALPIIGIALPFFFAGKGKWKNTGETLIGFGILFLGLGMLKDSVPDSSTLSDSNALRESILWIQNIGGYPAILMFLVIGVVLTLLLQSSSAAMAITIMMATKGWLGEGSEAFLYSAAIVLGENIGTTVTAWLAALPANVNAKRAARAHLLFNVIGVLWMLVVFKIFTEGVWSITENMPESWRVSSKHQSDIGFAVAIFHSAFNLINILLLIWFVPQIARIVEKWVKDKKKTDEQPRLRYISQTLVDLGELNVVEAEDAVRKMSVNTKEMFDGFVELFENPGEDLSEKVAALKQMEETSDVMMHDITEYLVRCSARDVGSANAHHIARMIRLVAELEECTDGIYRLVKLLQRKYRKGREFTDGQRESISELITATRRTLEIADQYLLDANTPQTAVHEAHTMEKQTDRMRKSFNKQAMNRMSEGDARVEMLMIDINNQLESLANHALNVVQVSSETDHLD
ncbi:Na/Pi cotransporter family protein [Sulfuriroseicoccus oceanibius]|uniref:Na/Pi cotransporter family protein n=1 Tax=Sulfuriroseicoccus oceanibius TaxID=2707525 RepID=A0A6B3L746_9BACT|nr:Na/Pi cotransporter family protein [Sulfuriroseicoccus oceanibius]QQL44040.1 Na/Pi cotransporter family protein [Sulfuriroseicoccus oceanibius]